MSGARPASGLRSGQHGMKRPTKTATSEADEEPRVDGRHLRRLRTEQRLVSAVGELLRESGVAALGVNAVAERAGVEKVLVYRYYGGLDGLMEAYAEGYAILDAAPLDIDVPAALRSWQRGSVVRSWLLDLLVRALDETPGLDGIAPVASDSGEGRWTVKEAVDNGVAAPVISAALFARFVSQRRDDDVTMKAVSALRNQFGGHTIEREPPSGGSAS